MSDRTRSSTRACQYPQARLFQHTAYDPGPDYLPTIHFDIAILMIPASTKPEPFNIAPPLTPLLNYKPLGFLVCGGSIRIYYNHNITTIPPRWIPNAQLP